MPTQLTEKGVALLREIILFIHTDPVLAAIAGLVVAIGGVRLRVPFLGFALRLIGGAVVIASAFVVFWGVL